MIERVVLGEIEGKNRAIHAYDNIVWKIRSGFLALLFGGWSIILTGIVEHQSRAPVQYQTLLWGLLLFSFGLAFGAHYVDRSYVRRKFRVISALDRLVQEVRTCGNDFRAISPELLRVAGDNAEMPYDTASYREASRVELSFYLVPLVILLVVVSLVTQMGRQ